MTKDKETAKPAEDQAPDGDIRCPKCGHAWSEEPTGPDWLRIEPNGVSAWVHCPDEQHRVHVGLVDKEGILEIVKMRKEIVLAGGELRRCEGERDGSTEALTAYADAGQKVDELHLELAGLLAVEGLLSRDGRPEWSFEAKRAIPSLKLKPGDRLPHPGLLSKEQREAVLRQIEANYIGRMAAAVNQLSDF